MTIFVGLIVLGLLYLPIYITLASTIPAALKGIHRELKRTNDREEGRNRA